VNKQAVLREIYNQAFADELEKRASAFGLLRGGSRVLSALKQDVPGLLKTFKERMPQVYGAAEKHFPSAMKSFSDWGAPRRAGMFSRAKNFVFSKRGLKAGGAIAGTGALAYGGTRVGEGFANA